MTNVIYGKKVSIQGDELAVESPTIFNSLVDLRGLTKFSNILEWNDPITHPGIHNVEVVFNGLSRQMLSPFRQLVNFATSGNVFPGAGFQIMMHGDGWKTSCSIVSNGANTILSALTNTGIGGTITLAGAIPALIRPLFDRKFLWRCLYNDFVTPNSFIPSDIMIWLEAATGNIRMYVIKTDVDSGIFAAGDKICFPWEASFTYSNFY